MQALYNQSLLSTFLMLQSSLNIQVNLTLISGPFLLQLTLLPLWRHRQYLLQFAVYPCRNKRWALIHSPWGHCGCLLLCDNLGLVGLLAHCLDAFEPVLWDVFRQHGGHVSLLFFQLALLLLLEQEWPVPVIFIFLILLAVLFIDLQSSLLDLWCFLDQVHVKNLCADAWFGWVTWAGWSLKDSVLIE